MKNLTMLGCCLLLVAQVGAQDAPIQARGFYLGAEAGYAESENNDEETMLGVFMGYRFNRYFALEAGYMDFGTYSVLQSGEVIADSDIQGLRYMAIGMVPFAEKFVFQGKLGAIYSERDELFRSNDEILERENSDSSFALEVGLRYHFTASTAVHLDWGAYSLDLWDFDSIFDFNNPAIENVDYISTFKLGISHSF